MTLNTGFAAFLLLILPAAAQPAPEAVTAAPGSTSAGASDRAKAVPAEPPAEDSSLQSFSGDVWGDPRPNVELPPQVVAEDGKLTLFADFEHPDKQGVPLYLVNRSSKSIEQLTNRNALRIQLERQLPSGAWERAQEHFFRDCNTFNDSPLHTLPPGMFLRLYGYQPNKRWSQPAIIRFVSYYDLPLVSNTGPGIFWTYDVEKARVDELSRRELPRQIVNEFMRGDAHLAAPRDLSGRIACLRIAEVVGEHPWVRENAQNWLTKLEKLPAPTAEESRAIAIIKPILARGWGEPKGLEPLLKACLDSMKSGGEAAKEFGSLAKESQLVWSVVGEIAEIETSRIRFGTEAQKSALKLWREVLDRAVEKILTASEAERFNLLPLFHQKSLIDENLPDEALERLLALDNPYVMRIAAETLVRRCRWEKLAETALKQPDSKRMFYLLALSRETPRQTKMDRVWWSANSPRQPGPIELKLWEEAFRVKPVQFAASLRSSGKIPPFEDGNLTRHIRAHWQAELKRSRSSDKDFELTEEEARVTNTLDLIARSHLLEDIALLHSLLSHRGYVKGTGTYLPPGKSEPEPCETHYYLIRDAAAHALKEKEKPVPNNMRYEINVKPDGTPL